MFLALFVYSGTSYAVVDIGALPVVPWLNRPRHAQESTGKDRNDSKALNERSKEDSPTRTPGTLVTLRETRQTPSRDDSSSRYDGQHVAQRQ